MHRKIFVYLYVLVLLTGISCSTQKNTFITRNYHTIVSRYNIYFNGREAFKSGILKIEQNFNEPYNTILPVFYYKDKNSISQASSDMDRAILKASTLIKNHSLTARPAQKGKPTTQKQKDFYAKKEYNKWVKEAYLLLGNALFYKQEYTEAQKNYEYIITEYKTDPIRYKAMLGLAQVKIERNQVEEALELLATCLTDKNFPKKLSAQLHALFADIYIDQEKFDDAISMLEIAQSEVRKKKTKIRYTFILAQLHQEINKSSEAIALYKQVEALNPNYEMTFQSRIKQATAYDGGGASTEIIRLLNKLLRDVNNKDYQDQIYYALANIYYQDDNEKKALENYLLSLKHSTSESFQKAMSYLAIGEIFYTQRHYINSQPYYDSCHSIISKDVRNYDAIQIRTQNLNALAREYYVVHDEDSLQRIANMPEKERLEYIDNIIADIQKREDEQRRREEDLRLQSMMYVQDFGVNNQNLTGKWYFYNETAVTFGKTEFITRWGDRKLEDNWRTKSKEKNNWGADEITEDTENTEDNVVDEKPLSIKSRSYYLKNLPLSDSLKEVSTKRIENSLFSLGMIYHNSIEDNKKAIETLESFITRFPNSEFTPIALYYLHTICLDERLFDKAELYKNMTIEQFPHTNYAKALTDPSFMKEYRNKIKEEEKLYSTAYRAYIQNKFSDVIQLTNTALEQNIESELHPKIAFLHALAHGKLYGVEQLKQSMNTFITTYKDTETVQFAKSILAYIEQLSEEVEDAEHILTHTSTSPTNTQNTEQEIEKSNPFVFSNNAAHIYAIIVQSEFVDINRIRFNMINYNLDYFTNFNFSISIKEIDRKYSMLVVEPFVHNTQAFNYYELIKYSDEVFEGVEKIFTNHCIIDTTNYATLLAQKNIDQYLEFFYENYIQ
ncbi:MAG: tetratricopeptide repeat protein [Bacteroidales bacterium]|nr:tetratricopeptide repeat protein [Bacteroidales bacterium]NLK81705.1 tetratricopeptide repeat protein [Bacteroidales bacterium]HPY81802.1 tetratricopeptide repeat protein [Bacteroidales bacterium]